MNLADLYLIVGVVLIEFGHSKGGWFLVLFGVGVAIMKALFHEYDKRYGEKR